MVGVWGEKNILWWVPVLSSVQVLRGASTCDQQSNRAAVACCKFTLGLQGKDTEACFVPKEEKKLHQLCWAAGLSSWCFVSPPVTGSQVRNIYCSWRDDLKVRLIVVIYLLLLLCCNHVELTIALLCSYLVPQLSCGSSKIHLGWVLCSAT